MSLTTPLHQSHIDAGAKLVDFHGWELPIHYGSQIDEHKSVRQAAGVFDVSHMAVIDVTDKDATPLLRYLLTNDVAKLSPFQALYSCMCNETGGVLDDLIVYKFSDTHYRLVVNAGTRDKDFAWLRQHRNGTVAVNMLENIALLAVQGPLAEAKAAKTLDKFGIAIDLQDMKTFTAREHNDWFIGRTGYTGEDGFELVIPAEIAPAVFSSLLENGVMPCGLGARDTLRLEAGMCLYGQDLDEQHSPVECGIGWTVDLKDKDRKFIGRDVLYDQKAIGTKTQRVALQLNQRGVMRPGQEIQLTGKAIGTVTSGTFSPTLEKSIALARVHEPVVGGCDVMIRNKPMPAEVVKVPFI